MQLLLFSDQRRHRSCRWDNKRERNRPGWMRVDSLDQPEAGLAAESSSPGMTPEMMEMPFKEAKGILVEAFEKEYLTHLLARHHGNISRAASEAGIDRNYIHRLVKKYNIPVPRS